MLEHDSPLCGASCGSVNVSLNNSLKFKNNKKNLYKSNCLTYFCSSIFYLKQKKNSIEPKSAVMADVVWPKTSATQCSGESCFSMNNYMFIQTRLSFIKSREKKMSKLFKRLFFAILDLQFLTCNSWLAILDLQFLTCNSWLAILDKREQNTMCHGKAQNVPQHDT
jgi:hypothetical protein